MEEAKLPNKVVYGYGVPDLTCNLMMMGAVTYYAYFLTDIIRINAAVVGLILLVARIIDAISVPISGAIIQKTQLKWGQFRSWMLVAPPVTALFFILMFTNFNMNPATQAIFLCVVYTLGHIGFNFAFNGHIALISVIGKTPVDRVTLSGRKAQFQTFSGVAFALLFMPLVGILGGGNEAKGFLYTVALFAILQVFGYWYTFSITKDYESYDPNKKLGAGTGLTAGEMSKQIFGNSQLLIIMLADSFRTTAMFGLIGLLSYYFAYIAGNLSLITVGMFVGTLGTFAGSLIAPAAAKRIGKKQTYILSTTITFIAFVLMRLLGQNYLIFIGLTAMANIGIILSMSLGPAMYMDAAEYGFFKTGKDSTALIMAMFSMPIKIGVALSGAVIGFGLAAIGYDPTVAITPSFVSSMMNVITLIPAACALLSFTLICFYKLDEKTVAEYTKKNTLSRAEVR
ncbi:Na+/melibiose symporter and related transporter-like protein [Alkaliphilus metalliredigens QYMF]|uniref:Na+/melibiose symporter and related transporter-like protein n=1 Tax=Alkaliphilus metalliredigens (strain QYMF) TaxID=293826 RepID=A6TPY6_ALKMQ|nr:MFS transporter [Alkaliphilus metalliredigens]ABR48254.1 Na+/melibiose symporter and related transporter-like protein [Alkaliphilus metalliredigens QYMF]